MFTAWTATTKGKKREFYTDLVEIAALALPPECFGVVSQVAPVFCVTKLFACSHRIFIWGHSYDLVGGEL
jgi:hypothetical protein